MAFFNELFNFLKSKPFITAVCILVATICIMTLMLVAILFMGSLSVLMLLPILFVILVSFLLVAYIWRTPPVQVHNVPDDQPEAQGVQLQNQHADN